MPKDHHHHPAALYCLKIWPDYAAIMYKFTDWVKLCPDIHAGILAINTTQPALRNALYLTFRNIPLCHHNITHPTNKK